MTPKTRILSQLADEAQHVAKTTTIDLDAFLALTSDERAARWRQFDGGAKQQLVALAIVRQTGRDWEPSEVAAGIAHYDARYGDGPLATEAAVCAALERLAAEHQRSFERAGTKGERSFFTRWAGAFRKALLFYLQGTRPEPLSSGAWLVTSATRGGVVHQVGKDNHCTCEARDKGCWHAALCLGIEVAHDDTERFDSGEPDACPICDGAGCSECDGTPLSDDEVAEQAGDVPCETCEGLGTMPAFGYGPLADGWKEPCEACEGKGHVPYDPAQTPGTPEYRISVGAFLGRRLALARSKLLMDEALGKAA